MCFVIQLKMALLMLQSSSSFHFFVVYLHMFIYKQAKRVNMDITRTWAAKTFDSSFVRVELLAPGQAPLRFLRRILPPKALIFSFLKL